MPPDRDGGWAYLDEELEVDIVGLGRGALGLLVPAAGDEIDTLRGEGALCITYSPLSESETRTSRGGERLPWRERRAASGLRRRRRGGF